MGALIGEIVYEVISRSANATRESLAAAMRAAADKIERGDIVPDEILEQARRDQSRISAIRDKLK